MIHIHLSSYDESNGAHYSVGSNDEFVLVQLQDQYADQARVRMTADEAERMASKLNEAALELRGIEDGKTTEQPDDADDDVCDAGSQGADPEG